MVCVCGQPGRHGADQKGACRCFYLSALFLLLYLVFYLYIVTPHSLTYQVPTHLFDLSYSTDGSCLLNSILRSSSILLFFSVLFWVWAVSHFRWFWFWFRFRLALSIIQASFIVAGRRLCFHLDIALISPPRAVLLNISGILEVSWLFEAFVGWSQVFI